MRTIMFMVAALAKLAPSQEQATTLATLAQRADVVVHAAVSAASNPTPAWRQLTLRTRHVLKGSVGATFTLTEPAG